MLRVGKLGLRLSVIVTTYNNPGALRLVLAGLERQTITDFELLIADDGSGDETRQLISGYASRAPYPVQHIWHADEGFQKCAISNRAIEAASGDYLIFFDGDCIPPPHCIATHVNSARPRRYLAGGKIFLNHRLTGKLSVEDIQSGYLDRIGSWWLWGIEKNRNRVVTTRIPVLRSLMDLQKQQHWRGENSSTFAEHIHEVGGFNERLVYGGEDADLGLRLEALGTHSHSVSYRAPVYHLDHDRPYTTEESEQANIALRDASLSAGIYVTPHGIRANEHSPDAGEDSSGKH